MAIFRFCKMATDAILDFQKVGILGVARVKTAKCVTERNFELIGVKLLLRYGNFSTYPRWRPSAILDL